MRIAFLYNHDAAHQVAHSIGIAAELAEGHGHIETAIVYGSAAIKSEIERHLTADQTAALQWFDFSLPPVMNRALAPLNRLFPARRLARLQYGASLLKPFDLVVSTERTCLTLKRRWGAEGPKFIYIPHGSGDRNVAYHPALKDFDFMLLSGQKLVDQMVAHHIASADQCRIIGYPKFDRLIGREPQKFFGNNNPVFLYNPHFDPVLSSWYDHGLALLEWFAEHPQYNLICAPHVMLFQKKIHISPEYKTSKSRPDIPEKYFSTDNILIDLDSERLFDMSYTIAADAYIGDVSSQVYEFLYRQRPVFFIDAHNGAVGGGHTVDKPAHEFWLNGPVVGNIEGLGELLPSWQEIGRGYRAAQERLMAQSINIDPARSAAERGAIALSEIASQAARRE